MPKKYMVELAQDERDELEAVLKSSTRRAVSATKLQRARILLARISHNQVENDVFHGMRRFSRGS